MKQKQVDNTSRNYLITIADRLHHTETSWMHTASKLIPKKTWPLTETSQRDNVHRVWWGSKCCSSGSTSNLVKGNLNDISITDYNLQFGGVPLALPQTHCVLHSTKQQFLLHKCVRMLTNQIAAECCFTNQTATACSSKRCCPQCGSTLLVYYTRAMQYKLVTPQLVLTSAIQNAATCMSKWCLFPESIAPQVHSVYTL